MKKWWVFFLLLVVLVVGFSAGVYAGSTQQEIKAVLDYGIRIKLNGQDYTPMSGGNVLVPIIYNGSTYLPVRAVSEAVNLVVDYDAANRIVWLGEKTTKIPLTASEYREGIGDTKFYTDASVLSVNGNLFKYGIANETNKDSYRSYKFGIKPAQEHQLIGGKCALYNSGEIKSKKITIYGRPGDAVLKEFVINNGETVDFEVNISGYESLWIEGGNADVDKLVFGELYFK